MKAYTFVAYKPYSEDYCRGHFMESYQANFEFKVSKNIDDIVNIWANVLVMDSNLGPSEEPHEVTVLINGINERNNPFEDFNTDDISAEINEIEKLARVKADERITSLKEEKEKKAAEEKAKKEEAEKLAREKQYLKLKEEFGPNDSSL